MYSAPVSDQQLKNLLPASNAFVPSLNGFRAVSILVVLIDHATPIKIIPGGFAVSIFFFISGFLITRILLTEYAKNGRLDLPRFYLSRFFRLFPVLVVALLFALCVTYGLGYKHNQLAIASVLLYFSNYIHALNTTTLESIAMYHTWSLSVEEHFYLIYPALMSFAFLRPRGALCIAIAAIAIAFALRIVYHFTLGDISATYIFAASETRMDFIAYGCLAALLCNSSKGEEFIKLVSRPPVFWGAVSLIGASLMFRNDLFRETIRYYFQGAALFVLIPAIVFGPTQGWLRAPLNTPLADWIGRVSYSLYLFHPACLLLGASASALFLPKSGLTEHFVGGALGIGLSFLLAAGSYYGVERPFLALRRRIIAALRPSEPLKVGATQTAR